MTSSLSPPRGPVVPKSAQRPEWWANEDTPATRHVQCKAWLRAGYRAIPQTSAERVRFVRRASGPLSRIDSGGWIGRLPNGAADAEAICEAVLRDCLIRAETTLSVSLLATLINIT